MGRAARPGARGPGWLGSGLILLGTGLALNSLLGPLGAAVVGYPLSPTLLNQTLGLDAFSLLVVAPLSVGLGMLALRRHPVAPVLALGPSLYVVYMFVQYIVGPDYLRFPPVLGFHLGLFVLGEIVAVRAWTSIDASTVAPGSRRRERALGLALVALGAFVVSRYLPGLLGSLGGEPLPPESRQDPAMFWTIFLLDLGIVVPAALSAGVGLLRSGSARAWKAAFAVVGWFALVGPSVAAMGVAMWLRDDPGATVATVTLFLTMGVLALLLAAWAVRPLFRGGLSRTPERT